MNFEEYKAHQIKLKEKKIQDDYNRYLRNIEDKKKQKIEQQKEKEYYENLSLADKTFQSIFGFLLFSVFFAMIITMFTSGRGWA